MLISKISNRLEKISTKDILETELEKKERCFDIYLPAHEIFTRIINKELIISDNGLNQYYNKLSVTKTLLDKLSKPLRRFVIKELAIRYDNLINKPLLIRLENLPQSDKTSIRAVLSNNYVAIDNYEILKTLFKQFPNELTIRGYINDDNSFKLEIVFDDEIIMGNEEGGLPDKYRILFVIENSETGNSSLNFRKGIYRVLCSNGLVKIIKELGKDRIRHIYNSKDVIINTLQTTNFYETLSSPDETIEMLRISKDIWVEKPKDEIEFILNNQPKKIIDLSIELLKNKYNLYSKTRYFDVINSITEAIHRVYENNHTRVELETLIYNKFKSDIIK